MATNNGKARSVGTHGLLKATHACGIVACTAMMAHLQPAFRSCIKMSIYTQHLQHCTTNRLCGKGLTIAIMRRSCIPASLYQLAETLRNDLKQTNLDTKTSKDTACRILALHCHCESPELHWTLFLHSHQ